MGGQGKADKDTYKTSEIYINPKNSNNSNNMAEDESKNEVIEEAKEEKESHDDKEVEKSDFQDIVNKNMETLTDVVQSLAETQKSVGTTLEGIDNRL